MAHRGKTRRRPATNIPSACRIASIDPDDAMILPHEANPGRIKFSERTGAHSALPWSFGYRELGQPAKNASEEILRLRKLHGRLIEDQGA